MGKSRLKNIWIGLVVCQNLIYTSFYYFNLNWYTEFIEILTLPLIITGYLVVTKKINWLLLTSFFLGLAGDYVDTFHNDNQDLVVFLNALNLGGYSIYVIKGIFHDFSAKLVLGLSIVYTVLYFLIFMILSTYIDDLSFEVVLLYNFFLGMFSVGCWVSFFKNRNTLNFNLFLSSLATILMAILYVVDEFIYHSNVIKFYGIDILFMLFHVTMFNFALTDQHKLSEN